MVYTLNEVKENSYVISGAKHPNLSMRTSLTQRPTLVPNVLHSENPECLTLS